MNNKISFKVQTFDKMKSNIRQEISLGLAFFIYFQTGLLLQYMSISQYCLSCLADKAKNSNLNLALFTSLRIWAIFFVISASNCSNCS